MANGEWRVENEQWRLMNREWEMGKEKWKRKLGMSNWKMKNVKC